jgi:hypothetical protein
MNASKLRNNMSVSGTQFVSEHKFSCGNSVPVYDVTSMHGLNQIIGHVKFNNREYGDVFYRGQCSLYDSLVPSLFRTWDGQKGTLARGDTLAQIITKMMQSDKIKRELKLGKDTKVNRLRVEGILQHYGVPTKCIDLVDNHWIALWMGLYECVKQVKVDTYYHFRKRELPYIELIRGEKSLEDVLYQYILLLALPYGEYKGDGLSKSDDYVMVDLRKALSSIFLRPHAQHGLVASRKVREAKDISDYDMAPAVVGVLRLRIDMVDQWLGGGQLVTQDNLFPPPSMDKGYDQLLLCQDLLLSGYELAKYV